MTDFLEPHVEIEPIEVTVELGAVEIVCPTLTTFSNADTCRVLWALINYIQELDKADIAKRTNRGLFAPPPVQAAMPLQFLAQIRGETYMIERISRSAVELSIEEGSVRVRFHICLSAVASIYAGVAMYPDFVDGVKLLRSHAERAVHTVFEDTLNNALRVGGDGSSDPDEPQRSPIPVQVEFYWKEDEEVFYEIERQVPDPKG